MLEKAKQLTFREPAEMLGQWGETHVILSRETLTVQLFRPRAAMAGQDWSTAVPHSQTQTSARLDKPSDGARMYMFTDMSLREKIYKFEQM